MERNTKSKPSRVVTFKITKDLEKILYRLRKETKLTQSQVIRVAIWMFDVKDLQEYYRACERQMLSLSPKTPYIHSTEEPITRTHLPYKPSKAAK